jgi:hypothetical protein
VRLVVDTNILISALLAGTSLPAHLITLWREVRFDLLTSAEQLDELMRVTRYPKIRERLTPALAGRLNELRGRPHGEVRIPMKSAAGSDLSRAGIPTKPAGEQQSSPLRKSARWTAFAHSFWCGLESRQGQAS